MCAPRWCCAPHLAIRNPLAKHALERRRGRGRSISLESALAAWGRASTRGTSSHQSTAMPSASAAMGPVSPTGHDATTPHNNRATCGCFGLSLTPARHTPPHSPRTALDPQTCRRRHVRCTTPYTASLHVHPTPLAQPRTPQATLPLGLYTPPQSPRSELSQYSDHTNDMALDTSGNACAIPALIAPPCHHTQRVGMSSGERPIGAAKGNQPNTEALCQPPPPKHTPQ